MERKKVGNAMAIWVAVGWQWDGNWIPWQLDIDEAATGWRRAGTPTAMIWRPDGNGIAVGWQCDGNGAAGTGVAAGAENGTAV